MTIIYKVWIHVKEIDEDCDHYKDCKDFEPVDVFESEDREAAVEYANKLEEMGTN